MRAPVRSCAALVVATAVMLCGCHEHNQEAFTDFGGDPARGATLIRNAGCGACHEIPGVVGAHGIVGPPLTHIASRKIIAGRLPNTPANLTLWLRDPQAVVPGNAMPNGGLTDAQARDIAAYLYTLR